jgi:hypothetical protein
MLNLCTAENAELHREMQKLVRVQEPNLNSILVWMMITVYEG